MDNIKDQISKRKKVRKTLLLKINDEIKEISTSKPRLLINSKTIQEIEEIYNRNNILLTEKGIIYSNYIKTETKIFPPIIHHPLYRAKSVKKKIEKSKKQSEFIGSSNDEDVVSPILNFLPKKIDLASKKLTSIDKRYTKNNESIQHFIENNLNKDKSLTKEEDQLNKSTKIEKSNLHKLIEKILRIKNNENMEKIIKKNIKKLRKYCYKFRKKKEKNNKIHKIQETKANIHSTSKNLDIKNNEEKVEKIRKPSHFKIMPHSSSKKPKNYLTIKNKRNPIKLKTLNEDDGNNLVIHLHKIKDRKPFKSSENNKNKEKKKNSNEESVPYLYDIQKELMKSSINKKPSKFDIRYVTNVEKNISRNKNLKNNKKKIFIKNTSLFYGKDLEKIRLSIQKEKKNKVELHDTLLAKSNKSNKKIKKLEINKSENKKNSFLNQVNLKKKSLYVKRKSKKKLIDSPFRKIDDYSICNTNYFTNIFTITQSSIEKANKINRKKSYNNV